MDPQITQVKGSEQIEQMCRLVYAAGLNIDYYPTNSVVQNDRLYDIDYECNEYSDQWSSKNWGIQYWSKAPAFIRDLGSK